ncbi:MAG: hypothetical protein H7Y00_15835 [Fimbriimonadaceae bacterium]|nr:hypothetical protein [Chitinophagales bacterium]
MKLNLLIITILLAIKLFSQNIEYATQTFKDTRIINGQSVENTTQGTCTFIISHRFGDIYQNNPSSILYNFFGFSGGANMRIGLDYGIRNWWEIGAGRSNLDKTYDLFTKLRITRQSKGDKNFPVTISAYGDIAIVTDTSNALLDTFFVDRFSYTGQLLIARKFSERLSLQLMPTFIHRNLVETAEEKNDAIAIGGAVRFQLTDNVALNGEYYYTLPDQLPAGFDNSAALGVDITTKGHVFQLQLTNSPYLIPEYFIGKTTGKIIDDDANGKFDLNIRFGFNISRNFKIGGRQY